MTDLKAEFDALQQETKKVSAVLSKRAPLRSIVVSKEEFDEFRAEQARFNEKVLEVLEEIRDGLGRMEERIQKNSEKGREEEVRERLV
uniref:Antitoxin n=1 Tax=Caenorhabditis tropicalis TaxID=1561998 RepID=A0A1I7U5A9_9PELO